MMELCDVVDKCGVCIWYDYLIVMGGGKNLEI